MTKTTTCRSDDITRCGRNALAIFYICYGVIAAVILGLLATAASASEPAIVIYEDRGGSVFDYLERGTQYEQDGTKVVIDGGCWSACTLFLKIDTVCATPKAQFHFHSAYSLKEGKKVQERGMSSLMTGFYPPKVQLWLDEHGGMPLNGWLTITDYDFDYFGIKRCS